MEQSPATAAEKVHISRSPDVCAGRPCIAGTRIRAQDIYVWHELQGQTPDQIIADFPHLTLADIYAALAYFWDHRDEILDHMRQDDALIKQAKSEFPSKLHGRESAHGSRNAISP